MILSLSGVMSAYVYDAEGQLISSIFPKCRELGSYTRFLATTVQTLGKNLHAQPDFQVVQLEFGVQVLLVFPILLGYMTVMVRDAPSASGVKSWVRMSKLQALKVLN